MFATCTHCSDSDERCPIKKLLPIIGKAFYFDRYRGLRILSPLCYLICISFMLIKRGDCHGINNKRQTVSTPSSYYLHWAIVTLKSQHSCIMLNASLALYPDLPCRLYTASDKSLGRPTCRYGANLVSRPPHAGCILQAIKAWGGLHVGTGLTLYPDLPMQAVYCKR